MIHRRRFLGGLITAPFVVRASSLMAVRSMVFAPKWREVPVLFGFGLADPKNEGAIDYDELLRRGMAQLRFDRSQSAGDPFGGSS